jgi:hypothetical protein
MRVGLVCALLIGSAAVRWWQERRIAGELAEGRERARFDLKTIPMTIGPWKGSDTVLDPQIARATGADQHVTRRYVNGDTGVGLDLILLYGPAVEMYTHIPEYCYPAAGYATAGEVVNREVVAGSYKAPFRSLVYSKGEGAQADLQEVYYSWWRNGFWSPDIGTQKQFERIPSMYKVQLARRITGRERRDVGNPCEAFLKELLPQIERRIATSQTASAQAEARVDPLPSRGK